jgi:MFS family permease
LLDSIGPKSGAYEMNSIQHHQRTSFVEAASRGASVAQLLPIMAAVFIAFLVIGAALPVLPLHVHQKLGLGTFLVGLVAGSQFTSAIVSRVWAGRHADRSGAKAAVMAGLLIAAAAGLLYFLSLATRILSKVS